MQSTICRAIQERRLLEFSYDGGPRVVEPHCHGVSTAGNDVLRAYQVGGVSSSGKPEGWRLFELGKMSGARQAEETFLGTRPDYDAADRAMSRVHCHL